VNYAIEMGSWALTYVPSIINIGSGIQKLLREYMHGQEGDLLSLL
jgi:hypothetical protein